jgi:hypothetical protein
MSPFLSITKSMYADIVRLRLNMKTDQSYPCASVDCHASRLRAHVCQCAGIRGRVHPLNPCSQIICLCLCASEFQWLSKKIARNMKKTTNWYELKRTPVA